MINCLPNFSRSRFIPKRSYMVNFGKYKVHSPNRERNSRSIYSKSAESVLLEGFSNDNEILGLSNCPAGSPKKSHKLSMQSLGANLHLRSISHQPLFKGNMASVLTLDAPGVVNDFYLSLIDWSQKTNIVAVGLGPQSYLWNPKTHDILRLCGLKNLKHYITANKFTDNGDLIGITSSEGNFAIFDTKVCKVVRTYPISKYRLNCIDFFNNLVCFGDGDGTISIGDMRMNKCIIEVMKNAHNNEHVCCTKFTQTGTSIASGGNDNSVKIWNMQKLKSPVRNFKEHTSAVKAIDFCPFSSNVICTGGGEQDKRIICWDINSNKILKSVQTSSQITGIAFSKKHHSEKELITSHGYPTNEINLWSYPNFMKRRAYSGHTRRILSISQHDSMVVSLSSDQSIRFWKIFQNKKKRRNGFKFKKCMRKKDDFVIHERMIR